MYITHFYAHNGPTKNTRPDGSTQQCQKKKTYVNIGLLKHDIRVMACWGFKKMHKLTSQCFKEVDMQLGTFCLWLSIDNAGRQLAVCVLRKKHRFVYSIRIGRWAMGLSILVLKWLKWTWSLAELMVVNVKHVPETFLASSNSVPKDSLRHL